MGSFLHYPLLSFPGIFCHTYPAFLLGQWLRSWFPLGCSLWFPELRHNWSPMQLLGEGLRDPRHVTQLLSRSPRLANKDDKGASSLSCFQGEMGLRVGSADTGSGTKQMLSKNITGDDRIIHFLGGRTGKRKNKCHPG